MLKRTLLIVAASAIGMIATPSLAGSTKLVVSKPKLEIVAHHRGARCKVALRGHCGIRKKRKGYANYKGYWYPRIVVEVELKRTAQPKQIRRKLWPKAKVIALD